MNQPHPFPTSTHHFQAFPIKFPRFPKMLQGSFVLLQEAKIHKAQFFYYHILKMMHTLAEMFHGEMHMDDGNMPKKFQQIPVHDFQEIDPHHL